MCVNILKKISESGLIDEDEFQAPQLWRLLLSVRFAMRVVIYQLLFFCYYLHNCSGFFILYSNSKREEKDALPPQR